jgi:hypothetical protein
MDGGDEEVEAKPPVCQDSEVRELLLSCLTPAEVAMSAVPAEDEDLDYEAEDGLANSPVSDLLAPISWSGTRLTNSRRMKNSTYGGRSQDVSNRCDGSQRSLPNMKTPAMVRDVGRRVGRSKQQSTRRGGKIC